MNKVAAVFAMSGLFVVTVVPQICKLTEPKEKPVAAEVAPQYPADSFNPMESKAPADTSVSETEQAFRSYGEAKAEVYREAYGW